MKRIELLENLKEREDFIENNISYDFYWAYKDARKIGLDTLNFDSVGFATDHEELFENLERFDIKEFTVSDQSTGLMRGLVRFKKRGYFPSDLIEIEKGYTNWNFEKNIEEKEYMPALLFKKN